MSIFDKSSMLFSAHVIFVIVLKNSEINTEIQGHFLICSKISKPRPHWGAYDAPIDPLLGRLGQFDYTFTSP